MGGHAPSTTERLKSILRRDLKLGEDAAIPDDMPLAGGEFDLDSLDMLMIVTSVEKEFGIKIDNEQLGRDAFNSIATLARFVEAQRG